MSSSNVLEATIKDTAKPIAFESSKNLTGVALTAWAYPVSNPLQEFNVTVGSPTGVAAGAENAMTLNFTVAGIVPGVYHLVVRDPVEAVSKAFAIVYGADGYSLRVEPEPVV